jgi:hypothetical protein
MNRRALDGSLALVLNKPKHPDIRTRTRLIEVILCGDGGGSEHKGFEEAY